MAKFGFSNKRLSIIDARGHQVDLSPQEAIELLQLLSSKRAVLQRLASQEANLEINTRGQVEIHLQQQQLAHLDTLKAAIPQLHNPISATNIFVAPADAVTERAIQLLEAFQIEYKLHPMLEESNEFAQG